MTVILNIVKYVVKDYIGSDLVSRLNDVTLTDEYIDAYVNDYDLQKIYLVLRDISETLAMFYDNIYNKNEETDNDNMDDMLKNWNRTVTLRFPLLRNHRILFYLRSCSYR